MLLNTTVFTLLNEFIGIVIVQFLLTVVGILAMIWEDYDLKFWQTSDLSTRLKNLALNNFISGRIKIAMVFATVITSLLGFYATILLHFYKPVSTLEMETSPSIKFNFSSYSYDVTKTNTTLEMSKAVFCGLVNPCHYSSNGPGYFINDDIPAILGTTERLRLTNSTRGIASGGDLGSSGVRMYTNIDGVTLQPDGLSNVIVENTLYNNATGLNTMQYVENFRLAPLDGGSAIGLGEYLAYLVPENLYLGAATQQSMTTVEVLKPDGDNCFFVQFDLRYITLPQNRYSDFASADGYTSALAKQLLRKVTGVETKIGEISTIFATAADTGQLVGMSYANTSTKAGQITAFSYFIGVTPMRCANFSSKMASSFLTTATVMYGETQSPDRYPLYFQRTVNRPDTANFSFIDDMYSNIPITVVESQPPSAAVIHMLFEQDLSPLNKTYVSLIYVDVDAFFWIPTSLGLLCFVILAYILSSNKSLYLKDVHTALLSTCCDSIAVEYMNLRAFNASVKLSNKATNNNTAMKVNTLVVAAVEEVEEELVPLDVDEQVVGLIERKKRSMAINA